MHLLFFRSNVSVSLMDRLQQANKVLWQKSNDVSLCIKSYIEVDRRFSAVYSGWRFYRDLVVHEFQHSMSNFKVSLLTSTSRWNRDRYSFSSTAGSISERRRWRRTKSCVHSYGREDTGSSNSATTITQTARETSYTKRSETALPISLLDLGSKFAFGRVAPRLWGSTQRRLSSRHQHGFCLSAVQDWRSRP